MRKLFGIISLSALAATSAFSQDAEPAGENMEEITQVKYRKIDVLDKSTTNEIWKMRLPTDENLRRRYVIEMVRESSAGGLSQDVRLFTAWSTRTVVPAGETYLNESFAVHPTALNPGKSSFGYMEEHDSLTGKLIQNGPMFYNVTMKDDIFCATFKVYFAKREVMVVKRYYLKNRYHLPLKETWTRVQDKEVKSNLVFDRLE